MKNLRFLIGLGGSPRYQGGEPAIPGSGQPDFLSLKPIEILCFGKFFGPEQGGSITGEGAGVWFRGDF